MKKILGLLCTFSFVLCSQVSAYTIHNKTVAEIPLEDYYFQTWIGNPLATVREKTRAL